MTIIQGEDMLTPAEAAALVGVAVKTLRRWIAAGRVPVVRVGAGPRPRIYLRHSAVADLIEETEPKPKA